MNPAQTLLHALLSGPGRSLSDLAEALGTDILTLAERLTTPAFQAALDTVRRAATALAEARALACGQVALTALAESCDETNPNPAERRRAASTLARSRVGHRLPGCHRRFARQCRNPH